MSVEIWFRDTLETETVEGDLVDVTNGLNIASAQGKAFTVFSATDGQSVMVATANIVKAREASGDRAFIGS